MNKVLVTGGAGFIGSHLVDKLIEMKCDVTVVDNLSSGKNENLNHKAKFVKKDIKDLTTLLNIDVVFHLAAIPRVPYSVEYPEKTSDTNIMGTIHLLQLCREYNAKMVFASSSSVYGSDSPQMLLEDTELAPKSPYALQKRIGEDFGKMFHQLYGINFIALRYFNVYGPRMTSSLALGKFLEQKKNKKPLTIFGDGEQTRGFCYVDDVVDATIKAADLKGFEVINVGSKESYSVNHLADFVGGEKKYLPIRQGDPLHTKANIMLAESLLNWSPKVTLEEGVKLTKKWYGR